MKKKVVMAVAKKGGVGKSVLVFQFAEKHKHAVVLDLDDATTTSMKQLRYRGPLQVKFMDQITQRIDRSAFNGFFESIAKANMELFVADIGSSVSEQVTKYFEINSPKNISDILKAYEIDLQLVCVIAGGNNFKATMSYLVELVDSVQGYFEIVVAQNRHFPLSENQQFEFSKYIGENGLRSITFDLVKDKGEVALRTADAVLQAGNGIDGLSPFTAIYFKAGIEELDL